LYEEEEEEEEGELSQQVMRLFDFNESSATITLVAFQSNKA